MFEDFHQQLKQSQSRNASAQAYISSIYFALAEGWFGRLTETCIMHNLVKDEDLKIKLMVCILRLFCGSKFNTTDWTQEFARTKKRTWNTF